MRSQYRVVDGDDQNRLVHILESSLHVQQFSQFFAWTQGPLQSLLPHEILICGYDAQGLGELKLRYFSASRYFKQEHFEAACNPRHGLVVKAMRHWRESRRPFLVPGGAANASSDVSSEENLIRLELKNLAAHGLLAPGGGMQSWFCLGRVRNMDEHTAHLLELLVPCISATYARAISVESGVQGPSAKVGNLLSLREVEVLQCVRDGYSNADIAGELGMSAITAKNHLQNIRKKLKVHTRGQAVVEAMRLGMLQQAGDDKS